MTKTLATALILTSLCLPPAAAFAQAQPPAGGPPPQPGMSMPDHRDASQMRQMRQQMEQIHRSEREKVLAALTPAHRDLLANLTGQLTVSQRPDPRAAAARLDAALTPDEKNAILAAHRDAVAQMRGLWQQQRSQMQGANGAPQPHAGAQRHERRTPSAGEIAMMVTAPHEMPMQHRAPGQGRG